MKVVDYNDNSLIENICVVYLIDFIDNMVLLSVVGYFIVIVFLIVDVFGVLFLISKFIKE